MPKLLQEVLSRNTADGFNFEHVCGDEQEPIPPKIAQTFALFHMHA